MATTLSLFFNSYIREKPRLTSLSKCTWNFFLLRMHLRLLGNTPPLCSLIYPILSKHLLVVAFKLALSLATSLETKPSLNEYSMAGG